RVLDYRKNQYGPVTESTALRWDNQHHLFVPMDVNELNVAARLEKAKDVFVAILRRLYGQQRWVSAKTAPNYAPTVFAAEQEAQKAAVSKAVLIDAMRALFVEEIIGVETYGPSQRHARLYVKEERQEEMNLEA